MAELVSRQQVLAYRIAEHGLHRRATVARELAVLDLGVQDSSGGSARLAFAARLAEPTADLTGLSLVWSYRGAPHFHHTAHLWSVAEALWPLSDADATTRLAWQRSKLAATGLPGLGVFRTAARAFRETVTVPMSKGAASAAVTALASTALSGWCRSCRSEHVFESLFRLAALPGGVRLEAETAPMVLAPIASWPGVPDGTKGLPQLIRAYLRLLGPATPTEVAGFLGSTRREIGPLWPTDLVEVSVDGRPGWIPEDRLGALRKPPVPPSPRLLPPSDPYLQARDRDLIVPDAAARKALWRVLGNPGAVLAGGEIVGYWRPKATGRKRLDVIVENFGTVPAYTRDALVEEAQRIARLRGIADARLVIPA